MSPRGLRKFKSIKGIRQLFSNTDQDSQSAPAVPLATQQSNTFSLIADGLDTASRQLFMQQPKGALGPPVGSSADIFKSPRSASPKPHSNDATRKTGGLVFVIHSKVVEFERIVAILELLPQTSTRRSIYWERERFFEVQFVQSIGIFTTRIFCSEMANAPRPAIFCYQLPFMEYGWGPEVKEVSRLHQSALSTGAAYSRPIIFDDRYQYLPGEDMRAALFAEDFYILDDDNFKAGMAEKLFDRLLQKARAMLASELQRFDEGSITLSNSPQQTAVSRPSCADRAAGQAQPAEPPTTPSPSAFARSTDTFILRGGSVYGAVEQGQDRPRSPAFGLY